MQFITTQTENALRQAFIRLENAVSRLIPTDTEDSELREARTLCMSVLMHASGITDFLRRGREYTPDRAIELRNRVHLAFGAPGDWGYHTELGAALRDLYNVPIERPGAANGTYDVPHEAVLDAMERQGGAFVSHLAAAWMYADPQNRERLMLAFGEYYRQYASAVRDRDGVPGAGASGGGGSGGSGGTLSNTEVR